MTASVPLRVPASEPVPAAGAAPKVSFVSLGCPKALVDSERIITQLSAEGYELARKHDGADVVIVNTCGFLDSAKAELLEAIGEAMAENGKVIVTGCMGAEPEQIRERFPDVLAITGPQAYEMRRRGGAPGGAAGARPVPRSRAAAGRQADAAALRLSEDLGGLQQPLQLLHHPEAARRSRLAPGGRRAARGRAAGARRGEGAPRHLPGHQRLRGRPRISGEPLARSRGADALLRSRQRARLARGLGAPALRLSLPACRRGHRADGRGQGPALSRHSVPARLAGGAEGDAPAGQPGKDARAHPRLARDLRRTSPSARPSSSASPARRRRTSRCCSTGSARRRSTAPAASNTSPSPARRQTTSAVPVPQEVKDERWHRFMRAQQKISATKLAAKVGKRLPVIIDEPGTAVAKGRSKYDAPEIDGAVHIASRRPLRRATS